MARAPATPRKVTSTQAERTAKRISRQQKALEKEMLVDMNVKIVPNGGKMPKLSDLKKITPMTDTQHNVFDAWENAPEDNVGFVLHGSAGTGKSYIAMYLALREILSAGSAYKKIILIRSSVQIRDMGFLKGTELEKAAVYELPYKDICGDLTKNNHAYDKLKEAFKIEFMSTSFLRGTTFNDAIVIIDESQSCNWHELNTVMTRMGNNSKLFVCGDLVQNDLIKSKNDISGFKEFLQVSLSMNEFRTFRFTSDDVVRSGFCKSWITTCEKLGL